MDARGHAAAHVDDDEIHVLVVPALLLCIADGHGAAVEHVAEALPLDLRVAGDLGDVGELSRGHSVIDICRDAKGLGKLAREQSAEVRGMRLAQFIVDKGAAQLIVNDVAARPEAEHQPAAAYDGGKLLLVNAVSLHE